MYHIQTVGINLNHPSFPTNFGVNTSSKQSNSREKRKADLFLSSPLLLLLCHFGFINHSQSLTDFTVCKSQIQSDSVFKWANKKYHYYSCFKIVPIFEEILQLYINCVQRTPRPRLCALFHPPVVLFFLGLKHSRLQANRHFLGLDFISDFCLSFYIVCSFFARFSWCFINGTSICHTFSRSAKAARSCRWPGIRKAGNQQEIGRCTDQQ